MKRKFYFVLMGLFMAMVSFAQGPVVYYPLDTDLKDASGHGNDATDGGKLNTKFVDDAIRGKVAFFDTSTCALLPTVDSLRFGPGQDFSFALWVKIDRVHGDPAVFGNKDWNNARNKGFVMYVKNADVENSSNVGIAFGDGKTDAGGSNNKVYWTGYENGAPDVIDGTWHSIAASFDRNDTLRVWVDGEPQYSAIALSSMPGYAYDNISDNPIHIMEDGTGTYNKGSALKGYIDEVRVWRRTITKKDIDAYSLVTKAAEPAGLSLGTTVYPNPSNGVVNVSFNLRKQEQAHIRVYSSLGTLVNEISQTAVIGQNKVNFNVKGWTPGIYLMKVLSESTSDAVRFLVTE